MMEHTFGKHREVNPNCACFLIDHEYQTPGVRHIGDIEMLTYSGGMRSHFTVGRQNCGAIGLVADLNELAAAIGTESVMLVFNNGNWIEEVPVSKSDLSDVFASLGLKLN